MLLPLCSPRGAYAEVLHQLSQRQQNRCQGRERTAPSRSSRRLRTAVIAPVHPQIAALDPAQGRKPLRELREERLCLRIAFAVSRQHADPPHAVGLLRAYGERPRKRSTTENGDEIPPPHAIPYVSFGARKSIALCDWPAEEQRAPTSLRRDVSVGSKKQISWRVCFYVSSSPQKLTHASQQMTCLSSWCFIRATRRRPGSFRAVFRARAPW